MYSTFEKWLENQLVTESMSRHCEIYMSNTGKWWLKLADEEYGEQWDSSVYGPFSSLEEAEEEIRQYSNPGGGSVDNSGNRPDPTKAPNGEDIRQPESGEDGNSRRYRF